MSMIIDLEVLDSVDHRVRDRQRERQEVGEKEAVK